MLPAFASRWCPHSRTAHSNAFLSLLTSTLLTGCALGPNYHRPPLTAPATFRGAPARPSATNSLADLHWWEMFQDDTLHELVHTALTNNYDLRIAVARLEQSRAILWQNRSGLFPQLGYQAGVGRGKNSAGNQPAFTGGNTADLFLFAGNASWEIDVWGRIRRLTETARAQYFASEQARRDVMVTLVSDVATAYFQLLALDQELAIAKRSTNTFGESLRIFSERLQGGIVSKLETSAAEAALDSAAATVPDIERQIFVAENQINVLLGRNPGPIPRVRRLSDELMRPDIPAGLPSALLERRPDIREAEENVRAANAQVGVAIADFFPHLSLTGLFGQVSPELSGLTGGAANAWNVAANLIGPIFQGGRLIGAYRESLALRQEAALRYQSTAINAFREVSNALISREKYAEARIHQQRAVQAYEVAVQVATERYIAGRAGYFEVLQEEQQLFPSENSLTQTELNQLLSYVQLYRALGGGWR
ncbi:MAG TPA: efflux transporter outer membrane subunit [Candidatus Dormibacteraeota bacterium]|nr:efflux transporter outer membrane subunit [Candidatus Dormibacteraeota bacterium]